MAFCIAEITEAALLCRLLCCGKGRATGLLLQKWFSLWLVKSEFTASLYAKKPCTAAAAAVGLQLVLKQICCLKYTMLIEACVCVCVFVWVSQRERRNSKSKRGSGLFDSPTVSQGHCLCLLMCPAHVFVHAFNTTEPIGGEKNAQWICCL